MNQADFIYGITDCVVSFAQNLMAEMLESMDESIREDGHRRLKGHIVRRNETTLQTSLSVVKCKKTRFKNKETGESRYLLDKVIGLESVSKYKSVENAKNYILGDWDGIMQGVRNRNAVKGCHAEGNVSHIYEDRMSSRPLGWSAKGADKMARLRVYHENGGNVLELARWQKKSLKIAVGAEEQILSSKVP